MVEKLNLKEYWFLKSVKRYEEMFGPKAFSVNMDGNFRSKRVEKMVNSGMMEVNESGQVVVSETGLEYLYNNEV